MRMNKPLVASVLVMGLLVALPSSAGQAAPEGVVQDGAASGAGPGGIGAVCLLRHTLPGLWAGLRLGGWAMGAPHGWLSCQA